MQIENQTMKNTLYYWSLIFGVFMLSACVPNQDANGDFLVGVDYGSNPNTDGGNNAVVKNVQKVTTVDMDGERIVATYRYTSNKITSVTSDNNSFKYTVLYSGNDISKMDYESVDELSGDKTVNSQTLTYTSGKLTSSKGVNKVNGAVVYISATLYHYSGDKIKNIITKVKDESNTTELFTIQTDYTFSGSNVSVMKYTLSLSSSGPVTMDPVEITAAFSNYDAKKNPLNNLPLAFKLVSSHFDLENNVVSGLSLNNAVTTKVTTNLQSVTSTLKYTYDADAYPVLGTSANGTVAFEYVK